MSIFLSGALLCAWFITHHFHSRLRKLSYPWASAEGFPLYSYEYFELHLWCGPQRLRGD